MLGVLARLFVLENLARINNFANTFGRDVGESTMRAL